MDPKIHCLASELFTFLSKISTSVYLMLGASAGGLGISVTLTFTLYRVPAW